MSDNFVNVLDIRKKIDFLTWDEVKDLKLNTDLYSSTDLYNLRYGRGAVFTKMLQYVLSNDISSIRDVTVTRPISPRQEASETTARFGASFSLKELFYPPRKNTKIAAQFMTELTEYIIFKVIEQYLENFEILPGTVDTFRNITKIPDYIKFSEHALRSALHYTVSFYIKYIFDSEAVFRYYDANGNWTTFYSMNIPYNVILYYVIMHEILNEVINKDVIISKLGSINVDSDFIDRITEFYIKTLYDQSLADTIKNTTFIYIKSGPAILQRNALTYVISRKEKLAANLSLGVPSEENEITNVPQFNGYIGWVVYVTFLNFISKMIVYKYFIKNDFYNQYELSRKINKKYGKGKLTITSGFTDLVAANANFEVWKKEKKQLALTFKSRDIDIDINQTYIECIINKLKQDLNLTGNMLHFTANEQMFHLDDTIKNVRVLKLNNEVDFYITDNFLSTIKQEYKDKKYNDILFVLYNIKTLMEDKVLKHKLMMSTDVYAVPLLTTIRIRYLYNLEILQKATTAQKKQRVVYNISNYSSFTALLKSISIDTDYDITLEYNSKSDLYELQAVRKMSDTIHSRFFHTKAILMDPIAVAEDGTTTRVDDKRLNNLKMFIPNHMRQFSVEKVQTGISEKCLNIPSIKYRVLITTYAKD